MPLHIKQIKDKYCPAPFFKRKNCLHKITEESFFFSETFSNNVFLVRSWQWVSCRPWCCLPGTLSAPWPPCLPSSDALTPPPKMPTSEFPPDTWYSPFRTPQLFHATFVHLFTASRLDLFKNRFLNNFYEVGPLSSTKRGREKAFEKLTIINEKKITDRV